MSDEKEQQPEELEEEELKDQDAEELPDREALSILRLPGEGPPWPPLPETDV